MNPSLQIVTTWSPGSLHLNAFLGQGCQAAQLWLGHARLFVDVQVPDLIPGCSFAYTNYRCTALLPPLLVSAGLSLTRSPPQINTHTRQQIHPAPNQLVLLGARALDPSPSQCPRQTCLQVLPCNHIGSHACMHHLVAAHTDLPAAGEQPVHFGTECNSQLSNSGGWRSMLPSHAGPSLAFVASVKVHKQLGWLHDSSAYPTPQSIM